MRDLVDDRNLDRRIMDANLLEGLRDTGTDHSRIYVGHRAGQQDTEPPAVLDDLPTGNR
jgi:hypothetical protein